MRKKINLPKLSPDIGARIRKLRTSQNIRQNSFAEIVGCSNSYLSDIEKGRTKPSLELLIAITKNTYCDLTWLITGKGNMHKAAGLQIRESAAKYGTDEKIPGMVPVRPVPILNTVPAGFPETPIDDYIVDWVLVPIELKDPKAFALIISGKSMHPKFDDGEVVIISPAASVSNGQVGAFRINGDVTIKRLLKKDGKTYLMAENPDYPPTTLKEDDELVAIGRAVYQIKKVD